MKRNPTRTVKVGAVALGSGHPVAVQSMCATRTQDVDATVEQAEAIRRAGGALVRVAVDSPKDVEALGRGAPADEGRPGRGPPGELPPRRERRPARRQGPLQPRAPLAPREGEAGAREGRLPRGRGPGERPRDPHRGQLRLRRPRDEGAPPRRRRPGHGGVRPRALPVHGRPGLRALRGEPQGLAPAQGDRGQPPLLRGPPGRAAPPRRDRGGHPARGRHQDAGGLRAAPLPRDRRHPAGQPHPAEPAQARGGDGRPPDPGRRGRRPLPLGARLRRRQAQHHLLPLVLPSGERALRGARGEGEGDDGLRGEARPDHRGHGLPRERPRRDRRRGPGPVVRPDPRQPEEEDRLARSLHLRRDPGPPEAGAGLAHQPARGTGGERWRSHAGGRGACRPTPGRPRPSASRAP